MDENKKIEEGLEKKIDELIDKKIEEKISEEVEQKVRERFKDYETVVDKEVEKELRAKLEKGKTEEETKNISTPILDFQRSFHFCWKGVCHQITWVLLVTYALLIILIFSCLIFKIGACGTQGLVAIAPLTMAIIIVASITSILLLFYSSYQKTGFIYWLILNIPIIILIFIITSKVIGFLVIALIVFYRLISVSRE